MKIEITPTVDPFEETIYEALNRTLASPAASGASAPPRPLLCSSTLAKAGGHACRVAAVLGSLARQAAAARPASRAPPWCSTARPPTRRPGRNGSPIAGRRRRTLCNTRVRITSPRNYGGEKN